MGVAMYKSELHLTICSVLQEQAPTTPNAPVVIPKHHLAKVKPLCISCWEEMQGILWIALR